MIVPVRSAVQVYRTRLAVLRWVRVLRVELSSVSNVSPGSYVITLNGNNGDSAQATFTVTSGASITLNPTSGGVGITVTVTGVGFRTDDSSCSINGSPVQNPSCTISLGTGTPSGSFVVSQRFARIVRDYTEWQ